MDTFGTAIHHGVRIAEPQPKLKQILPKHAAFSVLFLGCGMHAIAADLIVQVPDPVSRHVVKFQCDGHSTALGLPSGPFSVAYLNSGPNSLAVVPVAGHPLIFSSVNSGSGSRYAAGFFIWWDAGRRGVHLYSDSVQGKDQSSCTQIP
jgi:membrane-bound inhibitor of C-type lysozyme